MWGLGCLRNKLVANRWSLQFAILLPFVLWWRVTMAKKKWTWRKMWGLSCLRNLTVTRTAGGSGCPLTFLQNCVNTIVGVRGWVSIIVLVLTYVRIKKISTYLHCPSFHRVITFDPCTVDTKKGKVFTPLIKCETWHREWWLPNNQNFSSFANMKSI